MVKIKSGSFVFIGLVTVAGLVAVFGTSSYAQFFGRSKYTSPPASASIAIAGKQISIDVRDAA